MRNLLVVAALVLAFTGCSKVEPKTLSFTEQACTLNEVSSVVQEDFEYRVIANGDLGTGCLVELSDKSVQVIWRGGVEVFRSSEVFETQQWKVGPEVARAYSLELLPRNQELVTKLK